MRRLIWVLALSLLVAGTPTPARAGDPGGVHCPIVGPCVVRTGHGGSKGGGRGGGSGTRGGQATCRDRGGATVPCHDPILGWFDPKDFCYYKAATPPWPTRADAAGLGLPYHPPGDGDYYLATCPGVAGTGGGITWRANPPPGFGVTIDPRVLAAEAINRLGLAGPDVVLSPSATQEQIVGLPMWLATRVTAATWGRHTATAAVPGASVTAAATALRIAWDTGDGVTVACSGPGALWSPRYDAHSPSPTCGHTYTSASNHRVITATTTWQVAWSGAGLRGCSWVFDAVAVLDRDRAGRGVAGSQPMREA